MKRKIAYDSNLPRLGGERGVALIVVLWIFIFLFVVAFEFSTAAREEASAAHRFNEETTGYYLALAGFERGLYDFLNQQDGAPAQSQGAKRRPVRRRMARGNSRRRRAARAARR